MRVRRVVAAGAATLMAALPFGASPAGAANPVVPGVQANAVLKDATGGAIGSVSFQEEKGYVSVRVVATGLTPASTFHGFHIHENGKCTTTTTTFDDAGGHWNPAATNHGHHAGDMPALYVKADGTARASFRTDTFTVADLLADAGGVAVIVHAGKDNLANIPTKYVSDTNRDGSIDATEASNPGPDATTLKTGDAGGRIACGVVSTGAAAGIPAGYWLAARDGGVFNQGAAAFLGSHGGSPLNQPIVAAAGTASGAGYYLAAADGGIFNYGDATFEGSLGSVKLNQPIVGIAAEPSQARAPLANTDGKAIGEVSFVQETSSRVRVHVSATGVTANPGAFHGFHIHTNGSCTTGAAAFDGAGGHWNPAGATHSDHAGDLPPVYVRSDGSIDATVTTDRFTVAQLLADAGGVAVILHKDPDNLANIPSWYFHESTEGSGTFDTPGPNSATLNTGDAGSRVACAAIAATGESTKGGYWMVGKDGGVFNFGAAGLFGSAATVKLNSPIVGIAATPTGLGYWLVGADGGIFNYGDAAYLGSMGGSPLNKPIVGIAATPTGRGYLLIASDGGIFTFGDATFEGSTGALTLNKPIVGGAVTESGNGYWLFASDGGVFNFGDASFQGSQGGKPLNQPVVAGAAQSG